MAYNVFTSSPWTHFLRSQFASPKRRGFALIAVLLLAVLLTLIVVALFSLLNVETQSAGNVALRNQARQNALTALDIALGELQKNLGPDQRISASSSLHDSDKTTTKFDGTGQAFWTGAWKSYQINDTAPSTAVPTSPAISLPPDVATPGRPASFQRWLVSGPTNNVVQWDYSKNFSTASATDPIVLVGKDSTGDDSLTVTVSRMPADKDSTGRTGTYAWWVGDEGAKALITIPKKPASGIFSEILQGLSAAPRTAPEEIKVSVLQNNISTEYNLSTLDSASDKLKKIVSRGLIPLGFVNTSGTTFGSLKGLSHDITSYSYGVLSDVKNGGLKKDLSLLFELPALPAPYATGTIFTPPAVTGGRITRPVPKWSILYDYYNLYKHPDLLKTAGTGEMVFNADNYNVLNGNSVWQNYIANFNSTTSDNLVGTITPEMRNYFTPVVIRVQYLFAFYKKAKNSVQNPQPAWVPFPDEEVIFMSVIPLIHVWNPYNITLKSKAWGGPDRKPDWKLQIPPLEISFDGGTNYKKLSDIFDSSGGGLCTPFAKNNQDMTLKPGEIVVWGPDETQQKYIGARRMDNVTLQIKSFNTRVGWNKNTSFVSYALGDANPHNTSTTTGYTTKSDYSVRPSDVTGWRIRVRYIRTQAYQLNHGMGSENNSVGTLELNPSAASPLNTTDFVDVDQSEFPTTLAGSSIPSDPVSPYYIFTFDFKRKLVPDLTSLIPAAKRSLFIDPAERSYIVVQPTAANMQMAPFEFAVHGLTGDANSMPDGSGPVVPIDANNRSFLGPQTDGVQFRTLREFPVVPLESVLQLRQVPSISSDTSHPITIAHSGRGVSSYKKPGTATIVSIPTITPYVDPAALFAFPVGNAFAHPKIPANDVKDADRSLDQCFYFNEALADTYFFSTLAPQNAPSGVFATTKTVRQVFDQLKAGTSPLPNSRLDYFLPDQIVDASLTNKIFTGTAISNTAYLASASFLLNRGAFNVNSTSVAAWQAVLASLRGQQLSYQASSTASTGAMANLIGNIPVLRWLVPNNKAREALGSDPARKQALWNGYRDLTDAQIQTLAEKIVEQVKLRGPFRSVAEFLNRQISSDTALNTAGAVQTALDSMNSSIDGINHDLSTPLAAAATGWPTGYPAAGQGPVFAGAPGYVMQADLLNALAPSLSARSDTFVIRAYGDVMNNSTDKKILSRAWCEAVVQRTPNFVNPGENAPEDALSALTPANAQFGRRFKIVQFRWLSPEEI